MALPNLTRDQAAERAALVTVDNYRIELDLTSGERTFRSVTTVTFDALPGAETFIDIAADTVHSAILNGVALDVSGYDESTGIALTGVQATNVSLSRTDSIAASSRSRRAIEDTRSAYLVARRGLRARDHRRGVGRRASERPPAIRGP